MGHKRRSSAKKKQYAMKKLCQGFSSGLKTLTGRPKVHFEDEVESSDEIRHEEDSDDEKEDVEESDEQESSEEEEEDEEDDAENAKHDKKPKPRSYHPVDTPYVEMGPGWWAKVYDDTIPGFPICVPVGTPRMIRVDRITEGGQVFSHETESAVPVHVADAMATYMYQSNFRYLLNRFLDYKRPGHAQCYVKFKYTHIKMVRHGLGRICFFRGNNYDMTVDELRDNRIKHGTLAYEPLPNGTWRLIEGYFGGRARIDPIAVEKLEAAVIRELLSGAKNPRQRESRRFSVDSDHDTEVEDPVVPEKGSEVPEY